MFDLRPFLSCNLDEPFFDSLKKDYPDFVDWFRRKSKEGKNAFVWNDEGQIVGFLYVKDEPECECIGDLPAEPRMKIGTLKIADNAGGRRIGEGAIGLALWKWRDSGLDSVYLTVYPHHKGLISMLESFGFRHVTDRGGEWVYLKSRKSADTGCPKDYFPLVFFGRGRGKYLPIEAEYHDRMFPRSKLCNTEQLSWDAGVSNGVTKMYVATPSQTIDYRIHDVVLIYRKSATNPGFNSVVSSYCTVQAVRPVKKNGKALLDEEHFIEYLGNKTVFEPEELRELYSRKNVYVMELLYCGCFGEGRNVNYRRLNELGVWKDAHPYLQELTVDEVKLILNEGKVDVQNIAVD